MNFLNPEWHQNPNSSSKDTAILLKGWILPIGGASAGEGLRLQPAHCELRSRGNRSPSLVTSVEVTPSYLVLLSNILAIVHVNLEFRGSVVLWCSGAVVQWCSGAVVQWYRCAVVQRYRGT